MDGSEPPPTRRKVKYAPRSAPSRKPKPTTKKSESGDEDDGEARALLRCLNENVARRRPKVETKSNVQVAFGPGASSPPPLRTYGNSKGINNGTARGSTSKVSGIGEDVLALASTGIENQSDVCMIDATNAATDASAGKIKKEYKEPWDDQSDYPITLPWRPPGSGDPEILDEEEFGEAATRVEYDENAINSAAELGLLDESEQQRMLFFQLPSLPLLKQSASRKGKEKAEASVKGCTVEDLSGGYMGKMLVYKNGAVKLKLGEVLYDVSPGTNSISVQDVVAMNTAEKTCCVLGEIDKKAVVTPELDPIDL